MSKREPLYPHVPKKKAPLHPHISGNRLGNPDGEGEPVPPEYRYLLPLMLHPRHPYYVPGKPDGLGV